jgi:hypothetical protein
MSSEGLVSPGSETKPKPIKKSQKAREKHLLRVKLAA